MLGRLGLSVPLVQAPMAGVSTPEMAAAVSNAGALGSIAVGATDAANARRMIEDVRARTDRAFNVNLFVHSAPKPDPIKESAWLDRLAPYREELTGFLLVAGCSLRPGPEGQEPTVEVVRTAHARCERGRCGHDLRGHDLHDHDLRDHFFVHAVLEAL